MKPFDLQRALAGDKVVTRDGREVTQLTRFKCNEECLAGVIDGVLETWHETGKYLTNDSGCSYDLFMAPKTVKRWVNFYETKNSHHANGFAFETEETAKRAVFGGAIAIAVPVEFEEGYGCNE